MAMYQRLTTLIGKSIQKATRLSGSGGSAAPGLIIERIDPNFMNKVLSQLPHGVVLVTGTNGKTTTTKIIASLLEGQGLKVFTNPTGSNFTRGIVSALLKSVDHKGQLKADIAVLELDEAYAVKFADKTAPRYSLFLNVLRDQLDRFGEIDQTAAMLKKVAEKTTGTVVVNQNDPHLNSALFAKNVTAKLASFKANPKIAALFPSDDELHSNAKKVASADKTHRFSATTRLDSVEGNKAVLSYSDREHKVQLSVKGAFNALNATAAVAVVRAIMAEKLKEPVMFETLARVKPAFGRGEDISVNGQPIEVVLVKNPSGFRASLASFDPEGTVTMIAINDDYADGRDMSWLWDVDFESLAETGVAIVSGVRAYDMALRLEYDEVTIKQVEPAIATAVNSLINDYADQPKRIFCTYTAMLAIRQQLAKYSDIKGGLTR